jgi:methionyl aminopeptidase
LVIGDLLVCMQQFCAELLQLAGSMCVPGVTTDQIDKAIHAATIDAGAYPSTMNYRWYPKSMCTSINEVICHGIPDDRPLQEGDIINW